MLGNISFITLACVIDIFAAKALGGGFHTWSLLLQSLFVLAAVIPVGIAIGSYCYFKGKALDPSGIVICMPVVGIGAPFAVLWGMTHGMTGIIAAIFETAIGFAFFWGCIAGSLLILDRARAIVAKGPDR